MPALPSDTDHILLDRLFRLGNHDFFVGMSLISGNAGILLRYAPALTDEQRANLSHIQNIANSFHRLLRTKLAAFHIITTAQEHNTREHIPLASVLQEVADVVADPRNGPVVRLQLQLHDPLLTTYLNRDHVFLLFHTLATDALPFGTHDELRIQIYDDNYSIRVDIQPIDTWSSEHLDVFAFLVELIGGSVLDKQATQLSLALPKE